MKRTVLFIICVILILPSFYVSADCGEAEIVMVTDTAEIAHSINCHKRLPIASTTKIVTAIVVLENISDISRKIAVPAEACDIEGSSIYLYPNEQISIEALLYGLLLNSGNDAATALALTVSGSVEGFVSMMNEFADRLALTDTHFTNPHGLEDKNHYSSAYDMALIMRYAMQNDEFVKISSTKSASFRGEDGKTRFFSNHNRLLREYEHAVCGKTGYIKASGRCLVSSADKDGISLICVTLACQNDFDRHIELFDGTFPQYELYDAEAHNEIELNTVGAENDTIFASVQDSVMLPFKSQNDSGRITIKYKTMTFQYAPVKFGDKVGTAVYYLNGIECARRDLIAVNSAEVINKKNLFKKILEFFGRLFS